MVRRDASLTDGPSRTEGAMRLPPGVPTEQPGPDVLAPIMDGGHPLWPKGWKFLVQNCSTVYPVYYREGTEERFELRNGVGSLRRGFADGGCGDVLWLRSGGPTGTGPSDVDTFVETVLPKQRLPFTLITSDGDSDMPTSLHGQHTSVLLDHPLLVVWLTQNYDGKVKHPKLKPIPIGFDLHTMGTRMQRPCGPYDSLPGYYDCAAAMLAYMKEIRAAAKVDRGADFEITVDHMSMAHSPDRKAMFDALECAGKPLRRKLPRLPADELWHTYGSRRFGVSPRGAGLDCHRTWEMLYQGMIPIVKSSSLDSLYEGLPVVVVKEWRDLCHMDLGAVAVKFQPLLPVSPEVFTVEYWFRRQTGRSFG